jgi:hypothetical protein
VSGNGCLGVWARRLADGSRAVVLFNRTAAQARIETRWNDIGYGASDRLRVRDFGDTRKPAAYVRNTRKRFPRTAPS